MPGSKSSKSSKPPSSSKSSKPSKPSSTSNQSTKRKSDVKKTDESSSLVHLSRHPTSQKHVVPSKPTLSAENAADKEPQPDPLKSLWQSIKQKGDSSNATLLAIVKKDQKDPLLKMIEEGKKGLKRKEKLRKYAQKRASANHPFRIQ